MATTFAEHADDADPPGAAPVVRRQLLKARGSHDATPRVVLHLPDLDALSSVALGPPRPAPRRRVDAAHTVVAVPHELASEGEPQVTAKSQLVRSVRRGLVQLVKAPVGKVVEQIAPDGKLSLSRLLVVMQSPKILLAGVTAIALQFAALLAMFTGGGTPAPTDAPPQTAGAPQVSLPGVSSPVAAPGLIQTPLSNPYVQYALPPGAPGPLVVVQPTLPPPQTLPGVDPRDVPPWGGSAAPLVGGPQPTGAPPLANQPAALPSISTPAAALPSIPALQTGDAVANKPKARLQGTIKKASTSETAP